MNTTDDFLCFRLEEFIRKEYHGFTNEEIYKMAELEMLDGHGPSWVYAPEVAKTRDGKWRKCMLCQEVIDSCHNLCMLCVYKIRTHHHEMRSEEHTS